MDSETLQKIFLLIPPLLLAITLHEAAHAYAARHYGDHTAEKLGRITINPFAHIDPVGTILVPLVLFFTTSSITEGGFIFGWAKPVPVDYRNFANPRIAIRMTAFAGPLSNFVMLFAWGLLRLLAPYAPSGMEYVIYEMCVYGIIINTILFVLNMFPLLPLDGGRVLETFLPDDLAIKFRQIEPFGMTILIILALTGILSAVLWPVEKIVIDFMQFALTPFELIFN